MKKEKMFWFNIFRPILVPIFKFYYNPILIGRKNIPKDGPIIVVGNHVHIMDQCLPVSMTKRPLHYMAKKEYFDNKKVAWFFKMAGCISVNRKIKDTNASNAAIEVLNNGFALGLFPEGTRNGMKDEYIEDIYNICKDKYNDKDNFYSNLRKEKTSQVKYLEELMKNKIISKNEFIDNIYDVKTFLSNLVEKKIISIEQYNDSLLLPLKFGAVSMAKKTDAYIVPFGITGEYKFRSKNLIARIGKPFKVSGDLEKDNEKLRMTIINLMLENEENCGK